MAHHLPSTFYSRGFAALAGLLLVASGCDDGEPAAANPCGEHGEWHEDHCHCDQGYSLSPAGTCVSTTPAPSTDAAAAATPPDASQPDASNPGPDVPTPPDDANTGEWTFTPSTTRASIGNVADGSRVWVMEGLDGLYVLSVEFYERYGAPTAPGTYPVQQHETDYATCGTCIILATECTMNGQSLSCAKELMPRAEGEVFLSAMGTSPGQRITGELRSLVFQEVTRASDYTTTVVAGGDVMDLSLWAFDMELNPLEGPGPVCGGHGHPHGNVCHCDPGYQTDPTDPMNCIPQ